MSTELLAEIANKPDDFKILRRLPVSLGAMAPQGHRQFTATIIDLETMGLDSAMDEIIEIGLLSFSFSNEEGILAVVDSYNELQDPGRPIPAEIIKVTGITDVDVAGRAIDWQRVLSILSSSHVVICHNSGFDRKFLERQAPEDVQAATMNLPFACTIKDIDWKERGYDSAKLDYLNFKMGYFYEAHRALIDCYATLNLLVQEVGAFDELKANVRKKETLLCATNAAFERKDQLKARGYRWSDGSGSIPKCWWTCVPNENLADEQSWLDEIIYKKDGLSKTLPQGFVTAKNRYSHRAEELA